MRGCEKDRKKILMSYPIPALHCSLLWSHKLNAGNPMLTDIT
jgi:hypothetical protein